MVKIDDVVTKFTAYLLTERRVSANTVAAYCRDLAQFQDFLTTQQFEITALSTEILKKFLALLYQEGLSARSVARKISTLKLFFAYLNRAFGLPDLGISLHTPKLGKTLPKCLSSQEVEMLLAAADQDTSPAGIRNKVMLYLMYVSGMRVSELISVKLADLHRDTGFIVVQGKGEKQRMVPLPDALFTLIYEYVDTVRKQVVGDACVAYLFPVRHGAKIKPLSRQAFWTIVNTVWKKTGSKRTISPHQLRHSLATHLLKKGANLRSLQLLLGHEQIATVQMYTHVETSYLRSVYDKKHPRS